jgi:hypothetical protein
MSRALFGLSLSLSWFPHFLLTRESLNLNSERPSWRLSLCGPTTRESGRCSAAQRGLERCARSEIGVLRVLSTSNTSMRTMRGWKGEKLRICVRETPQVAEDERLSQYSQRVVYLNYSSVLLSIYNEASGLSVRDT